MEEKPAVEKLFSLQEIDELIKEQKSDFTYSLLDTVLFLLYADRDPIRGKIRQMKQVFLALKEVLPKSTTQPVVFFKKEKFGPYSKEVEHTIDQLAFSNYISISGKKTTNDFSIRIEQKGIEYIKGKFQGLSKEVQDTLKEKRHEWDTFTPTGIINYVYIHNKEFLENSVLKNRYKLDWSNVNQKYEKSASRKVKTQDDEDDDQ